VVFVGELVYGFDLLCSLFGELGVVVGCGDDFYGDFLGK